LQYNLNSSMTLNSSTAFNHVKRHDMTDVNGIPFETLSYEPRGTINSLSQELRLSGADPRLNWTVGGYYSKDRILEGQVAWLDDFSTVQLIRAIGVTLPSAYPLEQIAQGLRLDDAVSRIQTESGSLFANLQPQLTDTLKLTLGARYNIDRTSFRGCLRDVDNNAAPIWNVVITGAIAGIQTNIQPGGCLTFNPTLTALAGEVSDTLRQSNVSWRVGLDQSLSEDALLYGAITRGYKSGGFPIVPANISSQYEPFRQEEVTAYEVGAKLRSLGGSLRTTFAVFYDSYRDKQVFTVIPDPIFRTLERTQNVPKSRIAGAESETTWRIVPSLTAHASLAYINTRVLEYQGYDQGGVAHDFRGDGFPYSPNWQASGGLEHEQGVSSSLSVRSTVSYSYQSSSHGDFLDSALYRIPAYATVDGSVSLAGRNDRWLLSAWARNLLDKNYWTTVSYGRDMYVRYSGMPRTYGMTLTWNID
jgi:outer membrane receptor protein involved in Fe transport